jgi:hypothetical protein
VFTIALLAAFGFSSVFHFFWPVGAHAQGLSDLLNESSDKLESSVPQGISAPPPPCSGEPPASGGCPSCTSDVPGESDYEKSLPVPTPAPGFDYVVQLVNESDVTILATANAANQGSSEPGGGVPSPVVVEPRDGRTWVLGPKGAPNNGNVLTIRYAGGLGGYPMPAD